MSDCTCEWGRRCLNCIERDGLTKAPDPTVDARRSWQAYFDAGLPWTGEFEEAVNRGEVDVS